MKSAIGIDLGGTKINGGIVDEDGNVLEKLTVDTLAREGKDEVLNRIKSMVREFIKKDDIKGIGIGSPGFINSDIGKVVFLGNNIPDWTGVNIKEEIEDEFEGIPVFVENDGNMAMLCEGWIGAAKGYDSFVMITLGTGVGGGIYTREQGIWRGSNWQGAELGHVILHPDGIKCGCGQFGCAEQYISGKAIEKLYEEKSGTFLKGADIFNRSLNDDSAKEVVEEFTENLAYFLINIKNIFDPEGIIIGGGVINSREYWWDIMIGKYMDMCNSPLGMKIRPAKYLNDAGMIGSAKIVFNNLAK